MGTGEYECQRCKKILFDDYGKVRRYLDENGNSSILVLERETGVSKEVLEYLKEEGILTEPEPEEEENIKRCSKCGKPIEIGRYCNSCKAELVGGIAGAFDASKQRSDDMAQAKKPGARMHLTRMRTKI